MCQPNRRRTEPPCLSRRLGLCRWGVWGLVVVALQGLGVGEVAAQKRTSDPNDLGPAVFNDLAYGRDKSFQQLNLSLPDRTAGPIPLVIWIHGGAWVTGDKDNPHPAQSLVEEGFAVASVEYRRATQVPYPAQFDDCRAAVMWLRKNAKKYRIDPDRVGVWGHSAGGHLASMLGVRSGGEHNRAAVQAVCDWAGPVDLVQIIDDSSADRRTASADMMWRLFLGPPSENKKLRDSYPPAKRRQLLQSGSPLAFLKAKGPPFLVVHGDQDKIVPVAQSRRFVQRLRELENNVEYIELPGVGHNPGERPISAQRALAFFREHLQSPEAPRTAQAAAGPQRLEAEAGSVTGKARPVPHAKASGGQKVGFIDNPDSTLEFELTLAHGGNWTLRLRYGNGSPMGKPATHRLIINGNAATEVRYPHTGWDNWQTLELTVELQEGTNTLTFGKGELFAELDWIEWEPVDGGETPESPETESPTGEFSDGDSVPSEN